jgi:hypothetical protein
LDYKAWFSPHNNKFYQFNVSDLHDDYSYDLFNMSTDEALKKGYIRIYSHYRELNIESSTIPDERIFNSLKYALEDNTKIPFIKSVNWDVDNDYLYRFRNQSFFYSDSIYDGMKRVG